MTSAAGVTITRVAGTTYVAAAQPSADGVLLTATISPPPGSVARADPALRLSDYANALRFYLDLPGESLNRILFVDNSGFNLDPLVEIARAARHDKLVEFISFPGNDHPSSYGKVYGEFRLMDFGLARSSLFTREDRIWKVTGRLRLLNFVDLVRSAPRDCDLLCDLHNVPLVGTGRLWKNTYMELRAFCCTIDAYDKVFKGCFEQLGPRLTAGYLYDRVMDSRGTLKVVPRFPIQPLFAGHSGRHDRPYDAGFQDIKTSIRAVLRRTAPWLWI